MRTRPLVIIAVAGALLAAGCGGGRAVGNPVQPSAPSGTVPAADAELGLRNPQFWYQAIPAGANLRQKFGDVFLVAAAPGGTNRETLDEKTMVDEIHQAGARAFRYVQAYWYPANQPFDGLDLAQHLEWAYCKEGDQPLQGRGGPKKPWYFMDNNERAWHDYFRGFLLKLKADGWDGVMFDRGMVALAGGTGPGGEIWHETSTCTQDPVTPGATFSDAFVGMMALVKSTGLQVLQNYGMSIFDPLTPFRPNPRDPACQRRDWAECKPISDGIEYADYWVDEAVAHPRDENFLFDFQANRANEKDPRFGGKVLGLITPGTLGGDVTRDNVYFQWARVKIFNMPLGVFTGDDNCNGKLDGLCNRRGLYKELNDLRLGAPLTEMPDKVACEANAEVNCVWVRPYRNGASVVNVTGIAKVVTVSLAGATCRNVVSVIDGASLGPCGGNLKIDLPPWSGRPLRFER
ncbi:MAG: hypothetical protein ACOYNI_04750 [Acidimicrobiia bacterium]